MINLRIIITLGVAMTILSGCDSSNNVQKVSASPSNLEGINILSGDVTYTLDSAEEIHELYPDTFWIPSRDVRENLEVGQLVKLLFRVTNGSEDQVERMWVEISKVTDDGYEGILDNDPYCTKKITAGLKVTFQAKHVIEIYKYDPSE